LLITSRAKKQPPRAGSLRVGRFVVGRRLRAEYDPLEIGVDSLDAIRRVLLLALKPLLALRVLLCLAVEFLAPLLEIVVGFSRQGEETPLQSCSSGGCVPATTGTEP
jgi:hypothetical protein